MFLRFDVVMFWNNDWFCIKWIFFMDGGGFIVKLSCLKYYKSWFYLCEYE